MPAGSVIKTYAIYPEPQRSRAPNICFLNLHGPPA